MSTEDLVRQILELVYESEPVSSDPVVQRAAIRSGVWDLVQKYTEDFEEELLSLQGEVNVLEDALDDGD